MSTPSASVIVVSRNRPSELRLCLLGLLQLYLPRFELVVVADQAGLDVVADLPLPGVKTALFEEANISAARNIGLSLAAGEVVAFIDDDAVPEPTWLSRLLRAFDTPEVAAATGFVRGRNGISYQWRGMMVDRQGDDHPLEVAQDGEIVYPKDGRVAKTVGTNAAFRRNTLAAIGGFDPAFRFYLDETDVNLRLAAPTAIIPSAQVHHGFAPNASRKANRAPTDLHEIAASSAVFLRKHGDPETGLAALRKAQSLRLALYAKRGALRPDDIDQLMDSLEAGIADGMERRLTDLAQLPDPPAFAPLERAVVPIAHQVRRGKPTPEDRARQPDTVITAMSFWPSPRRHQMRFTSEGYWLQSGGLWGKSDRNDPAFQLWTSARRRTREAARIAPFRDPDS